MFIILNGLFKVKSFKTKTGKYASIFNSELDIFKHKRYTMWMTIYNKIIVLKLKKSYDIFPTSL